MRDSHNDPLAVPRFVVLFELTCAATLGSLYRYLDVLRTVRERPLVLIIRFRQIRQITARDAYILKYVISMVSAMKITLLFSDVDAVLGSQLNSFRLAQKLGNGKVFSTLRDALEALKR